MFCWLQMIITLRNIDTRQLKFVDSKSISMERFLFHVKSPTIGKRKVFSLLWNEKHCILMRVLNLFGAIRMRFNFWGNMS